MAWHGTKAETEEVLLIYVELEVLMFYGSKLVIL